jgi:hypothetical protein
VPENKRSNKKREQRNVLSARIQKIQQEKVTEERSLSPKTRDSARKGNRGAFSEPENKRSSRKR